MQDQLTDLPLKTPFTKTTQYIKGKHWLMIRRQITRKASNDKEKISIVSVNGVFARSIEIKTTRNYILTKNEQLNTQI